MHYTLITCVMHFQYNQNLITLNLNIMLERRINNVILITPLST